MSRVHRAFTLIEILITVAIIGILAALAVPNFLLAQTRSKLARVEADMAAETTALEAYRVDHNHYPPYDANRDGREDIYLPFSLTSPVAYLTSIPSDPFNLENFIPFVRRTEQYREREADLVPPPPYATTDQVIQALFPQETSKSHSWVLFSWGPDLSSSTDEGGTPQPLYDPTNGTTSVGEIARIGP
jgi:prepilin-type N-terminal cleavage/methylation domain-containing protein